MSGFEKYEFNVLLSQAEIKLIETDRLVEQASRLLVEKHFLIDVIKDSCSSSINAITDLKKLCTRFKSNE